MTQEPRSTSNLTEELSKLGNQVAEAVRLAWESDERKRVQADIAEGVKNFSVQLDEAVRKASESEAARKVKLQAEQVATKAKDSDVVDDMREGLLVGLQSLNRELGKLLVRLETGRPSQAAGSAPAWTGAAGETGPVPPAAPAAPSETNTEPPASPSVEI